MIAITMVAVITIILILELSIEFDIPGYSGRIQFFSAYFLSISSGGV
jgi:hypothetical protein